MSAPVSLLMLDGDGIGPEIVAATRTVLEAADSRFGLNLAFAGAVVGFDALKASGSTIPDAVIAAALDADGIVLGPVSHNAYPPVAEGGLNPSGTLRKRLDLFANIRPAATRPGVTPPCGKPFDLVVVRENTEGFYADRNMASGPGEIMPEPDIALALRKITRRACRRIAESAFRLAATRPARHVTAVHKANVLRLSDGLFLEECRAVAKDYPDIAYDEVLVDAMAALLVRDAGRYDVVVTTNMYGDILSDLAAELSGSLGLAASLNAGEHHGMAQAQHGSAPDIAGKDIANPASLIGSAAMLLDWLGERKGNIALRQAAAAIESALEQVLADPAARTPDLGGSAGTQQMARAVAARL
ncbi:isocitrate/isopropylmalate dehydrogenase family protein [Halovulum dunhuangense]|uniref:Isocitrate/isopropylmalate dehydrogenase family protein n=1 Tax=Halovulum dunhuangense TaxID=1505036 RepID=A0A849L6D9_9RHOB|nr:isocitrate/isopropylmalate dehydrogenase family protein [Halovulum dunhuangense]NNU81712.1 isocitrate/isopropylmalate dehydrogenase family protein [Halovulum dunhuangense]